MSTADTRLPAVNKAKSPISLFWVIFLAVVLAIVVGGFWLKWAYFPTSFTPVSLSKSEEREFVGKLAQLGIEPAAKENVLQPEPYSEVGVSREVKFTEKEINSYIAKNNPELATRLALDLSDNLASAKILIPFEPDFPILGGETLRINAGVELAFRNNRPVVKLKGVSFWGVPLPNAWLGDLKNIDLVSEYGDQDGFWQSFADGIAFVQVSEGKLVVILNE